MTAAEDTTSTPSLADAVNARLDELGWSRGTLSARSRIDYATLSKVCRGAHGRAPTRRTLSRLDVALDWPEGTAESLVPGGGYRPETALEGHRGTRGRDRHATVTAVSAAPSRPPVPEHQPRDVMHLDVPPVAADDRPQLALPDPALRWRSPRNLAGRVEQVERWTYALAVARILVKEAEGEA